MKFRPCIDIHNGKVKQIVGGSLTDVQDQASENFVSENQQKNRRFLHYILIREDYRSAEE